MYKFQLPSETVKNLYILREYCGEASIVGQVRTAVQKYLQDKERQIGCPISDVQEAREKHHEEENSQDL